MDRRRFLRLSATGGAAVALAPWVPGCRSDAVLDEVTHDTRVPGLEAHFDASQLSLRTWVSDDFTRTAAGALGVSSSGHIWEQHGDLVIRDHGVRSPNGSDAAAFVRTRRRGQVSVEIDLEVRSSDAVDVYAAVRGTAPRGAEFALTTTMTTDRVVTEITIASVTRRLVSEARLSPETLNTLRVELTSRRVEVLVNDRTVSAGEVLTDVVFERFGFGFGGGDGGSVVRGFVLRELNTPVPADRGLVCAIPQLCQPSRYLQARQGVASKRPRYVADGGYPAVLYDGESTCLETNVPAGSRSFTLFAVVERTELTAGTIIGASAPSTGFQLRIAGDGVVEALDHGHALARSKWPVVDVGATIICVTLDSVGNIQMYLDGRPAAFVAVAAPARIGIDHQASMILGADGDGDHFAGRVLEVLRWSRPLSGGELRAVHADIGSKWGIELRNSQPARTPAPLTVLDIKGSNIIPSNHDLTDAPDSSAWLNLWARWDWAWIERSVRRSAAQGANVIRLIGDVNAVQTGAIDEATYHHRLDQVTAFCAQERCRFYYCAIDLRHKRNSSPEFVADFLTGVAGVLARHPNVMAIDLCNEVASAYPLYSQAEVVQWIHLWSEAIRGSAPHIPLSVSDVARGGLADKIAAAAYYEMYVDAVDFFDIHVYDEFVIADDSELLAPYEMAANRPLLIGEFGANRQLPHAAPGAYYAQVRALRDSSSAVVGAIQWGAVKDDFGLYSETGDHLQTDIAPEWALF